MVEGNLARAMEVDRMSSSEDEAEVTMAGLARECLVAANHSQNAAMDLMADKILRDAELMDRFARPLIRKACSEVIGRTMTIVRTSVMMPQPESDGRGAVIALAAGNRATLYDFPLPGGKRLGEATGEEVTAAARFYDAQATDMTVKAKWLSLIAKKVKKAETVSKALSLDDLSALQIKARGA